MVATPSTNGNGGRDPRTGRYLENNPGGPGNPMSARVQELRQLFYSCVTDEDMKAVVKQLVAEAKSGNVQAIKEYLERALGKTESADLVARIDQLEGLLRESMQQGPKSTARVA